MKIFSSVCAHSKWICIVMLYLSAYENCRQASSRVSSVYEIEAVLIGSLCKPKTSAYHNTGYHSYLHLVGLCNYSYFHKRLIVTCDFQLTIPTNSNPKGEMKCKRSKCQHTFQNRSGLESRAHSQSSQATNHRCGKNIFRLSSYMK